LLISDETQRLRDLLKERDEEIERLEDASQAHEGEESKVSLVSSIQVDDSSIARSKRSRAKSSDSSKICLLLDKPNHTSKSKSKRIFSSKRLSTECDSSSTRLGVIMQLRAILVVPPHLRVHRRYPEISVQRSAVVSKKHKRFRKKRKIHMWKQW
jgi:hypothetical protein